MYASMSSYYHCCVKLPPMGGVGCAPFSDCVYGDIHHSGQALAWAMPLLKAAIQRRHLKDDQRAMMAVLTAHLASENCSD